MSATDAALIGGSTAGLDPAAEAARAVEVERAWRRRAVLARAGVAERIDGDLGTVARLPYP